MAAAIPLAPPEPLKQKGNLADNWRQWKQNFNIYITAVGIDKGDDKQTCALFLHTIGQYGRDIFNELEMSEDEIILNGYYEKFENYCNPPSNATVNRCSFFTTKQQKHQPFDKFLMCLKQKSKACAFDHLEDSLLMTQIIIGINNVKLRERLLRKPELNLCEVIEECRTTELTEAQAPDTTTRTKAPSNRQQANIKNPQNNKPTWPQFNKNPNCPPQSSGPRVQRQDPNQQSQFTKQIRMIDNCRFCGGSHVYGDCPAFGTTCHKCQQSNHFARVCPNKKPDGPPAAPQPFNKNPSNPQTAPESSGPRVQLQHQEQGQQDAEERKQVRMINKCRFCGDSHVYGDCPAFGTICHKCQQSNHFAKVCPKDKPDSVLTENRNSPPAAPESSGPRVQQQHQEQRQQDSKEQNPFTKQVHMIDNCHLCGGSHVYNAYGDCPAYGMTCRKCGKPNHFARVCPRKKEECTLS